jgi:serine/threonine protein phosphatase 1
MNLPISVSISEWIAAPVYPEGRQFIIGDVHGCISAFSALIEAMGRNSHGEGELTLLGDLIDRGIDSPGCLILADSNPEDLGFTAKYRLLGNHEILLLMTLDESYKGEVAEEVIHIWIHNGGINFLSQCGIKGTTREEIVNDLRCVLSHHTLKELQESLTHRISGNIFMVHAGVLPNSHYDMEGWITSQPKLSIEDMHFAWIRFPFFSYEDSFEKGRIVVHGHTPESSILKWKGRKHETPHRLDGYRLGLDGGSYATGIVAGAELKRGFYRIYLAQPLQTTCSNLNIGLFGV